MSYKIEDDLLVTSTLRERLQEEADMMTGEANSKWWAGFIRSNAEFRQFPMMYVADYSEVMVAENLLRMLNKELHHDGAWIAQWIPVVSLEHHYLTGNQFGVRLNAIWIDEDGDPQFTVEFDQDAYGMAAYPLLGWISQCADAWGLWYKHMREILAPNDNQLFKRAKGQKRISARPMHDSIDSDIII